MSRATARIFVYLALNIFFGLAFIANAFAQEPTPFFTSGNLVVSVEGNGVVGGSGAYGDNQAAPLTLFQFELNPSNPTTAPATYVDSLVLPQTGSGANLPVSGEYGSSSEGALQLAGTDQYLTIMGYGINANAFNADPTLYGIPGGELAQSGSLTGQSYTPIQRVVTLIDPYGNVNSSTGLFNVFNGNNPRSAYTADGIHMYVSGQGTSGDATSGVFYTTLGSSSATSITGADAGSGASQDTRTVQIYNNTLYVSMDSKSGAYNRSYVGTLGTPPATSVFSCTGVGAGCPTGDGTIGPALMKGFGNTGGTGREQLIAAQTNGINAAGDYINLSPENYFFASPTVLYVADSGSPKNTSAQNQTPYTLCGAGGLQKWVNVSGTWTWEYTLYQGLNLVANAACSSNTDGTTGLIGLTGVVSGTKVYLYATNYTIADLDPTYVYGITDVLAATTNPGGESFTQLAAAPADSNFKGVAFAPTLPAGSATITSAPSGLAFTSAGTGCAPGTYTTPVTLIWTPGVSCTLSVGSPQTASGAQYSFAHWQDGTTSTTDTVTAPTAAAVYTASFTTTTSITVTSVSPATEDYGSVVPVAISATLTWAGNGPAPTASDVTIGGSGLSGGFGTTSCGAPSGDSMTCTNTYTPSGTDAPGAYTITAAFTGDANYTASGSTQTNNFTINQASAGTVITSSGSPSIYGQSVTFTATITGENGQVRGKAGKNGARRQIVTGSVVWSGNTGCGTTPVTSGNPGTATCTTATLPVGADTITATYSGDGNHGGSTGMLSQTVNQASTSTSVTSVSPATEDYGSTVAVTISATLSWSGSGSAPTASDVTIGGSGLDGSFGPTSCGAPSGDTITCTNTYTPSGSDAPGSYTIAATFAADGNYTASSSPQTNNFTINPASATTVVTSGLSPSTYGQSVTLTATITGENNFLKGKPTKKGPRTPDVSGTVAWSANTGCGTTAVSSGNPGVATCTTSTLAVGTDAITATYSGDGNHSISTGTFNQVVNQAATTVAVTSVSPTTEDYGQDAPVTITAVLSWTGSGSAPTASDVIISGNGNGSYGATSCGAPSGTTMTCTAGYTPTTADAAGSYTETASFAGDSNYTRASSAQTNNFTINPASVTTVVTSSLNPSTFGQSVTFTATISGEYNFLKSKATRKGAPGPDVSGTVAWSANTGCGTTALSSGNPGVATCTTSTLAAGTDPITATYSGDGNHSGSTGTLSGGQLVNQASQTITFTTRAPASAGYNTTFTVAATASSGLPVSYASSGVCTNSGATYTMTQPTGTCSVTASQSGNGNYLAASPVSESTTATKATPVISFTGAPATATYGSSFSVAATSNSGVTPTIMASSACSINGTTVTMKAGSGVCTLTAKWAANTDYLAASATQKTTAEKLTPAVTFTGAPKSAAYLSTFTVATTQNSGITPTITSTTMNVCSVSGDTVTMKTGVGTCTVKASWAANAYYMAASLEQSTTASLLATTTTITNAVPQGGALMVMVYFAVSNGTSTATSGYVQVTAASGQTCTGTVTSGKCMLKFTSAESTTVTAAYEGNNDDSSSTSAPYALTVQ